jgi:ADP-L-glycero-D-manno-heptose 6-epimerase
MSKTVLVTGATGFIGYHLCNKLYEEGYRIIAFGRKDENKIKCHEFYTCSLSNIPWNDIPNINICFHLAANNNILEKDEQEVLRSNYYAPMSVFKSLLDKGCSKFIYASSCYVYGNNPAPFIESQTLSDYINPYAKSKSMFEKFAAEFSSRNKIPCIGLRYTNVYGTHESHKLKRASIINQIIQKISRNERPRIFKDGNQKKDWVYINDVIEANMLSIRYNQSDIFNIGSGDVVSFNSIIEMINKKMSKNITPEYVDCSFSGSYQSHTSVSLDKSKSKLKYHPRYSVDDGIQDIKIKLKRLFT